MSMLEFLLTVLVVNLCSTLVSTEVCSSEECMIDSEYIQSNINMSADPCVDMYDFACGGWMEQHYVTENHGKRSPLSEILLEDGCLFKGRNSTAVSKLKKLYRSCMNFEATEEKGSQPLRTLIGEYGPWTVAPTNTSWNRRAWTLQEALQRAHNLTGTSFWSIRIDRDQRNGSRNLIHIYQSGLSLPKHILDYSRTYVRDQFIHISTIVGQHLGGCEKNVKNTMYRVYKLERALARIFDREYLHTNPTNLYNLKTLSQFQEMLGNWIVAAMDDIEHAFINSLDQLSWMDENTKRNLLVKRNQ
ncbi:hypothetical protein Btru_049930 [Bulinus truncatus]|nr:hypothetical protein Btru_049930 [Bulinus truncatus]